MLPLTLKCTLLFLYLETQLAAEFQGGKDLEEIGSGNGHSETETDYRVITTPRESIATAPILVAVIVVCACLAGLLLAYLVIKLRPKKKKSCSRAKETKKETPKKKEDTMPGKGELEDKNDPKGTLAAKEKNTNRTMVKTSGSVKVSL